MTPGKIIVGTVCFIIDEISNKLLLLERSNEPMQGLWTGVGGKTHFSEGIYESCIREIYEETGLTVEKLQLRGVVKTILSGGDSSWILHIYVCREFSGSITPCSEGRLEWINIEEVYGLNLIGFLRGLMPIVLNNEAIVEGTIVHDTKGAVIKETIRYNAIGFERSLNK